MNGGRHGLENDREAAGLLKGERVVGDLNRLSAEPMSGYHVQLDRKIPGLGADFTFLIGSSYALSLIDVTPAIVENCFSSGNATDEAMVSGLAPGSPAVTRMVGKSTLGRSATGSCW